MDVVVGEACGAIGQQGRRTLVHATDQAPVDVDAMRADVTIPVMD